MFPFRNMEVAVSFKYWSMPLLLLSSGAVAAESDAAAYEQMSIPGKHIVIMRPADERRIDTIRCHPDPTKSIACEAYNQAVRGEMRSRAEGAPRPTER